MAKNDAIVGINSEHAHLSLTLSKGRDIKKSVVIDVPENIAQHGEIKSKSLFASLLKDTLKANGISVKQAGYVISSGDIFIRNITIPKMSEEQVRYNVPFEFRDYIRGELKEYIFDYAYRPPLPGEEDAPTMNLLAVAVPVSHINDIREMMKMAGLKLTKAVPEVCVYENLLRQLPTEEEQNKERCFLDIGNSQTRMLIYKNTRYKLVHVIDIGTKKIVDTIADELNVDAHLAKTYLDTRYQECDELPAVQNVYRDISIEILKGLNFYEVSDMSARLKDIVLCGIGAKIEPLVDILKERITMDVVTMRELYDGIAKNDDFNVTALSYGVLL